MSPRRFAEDTAVSVTKSQEQIKALLKRSGATQIAVFESANAGSAVLFQIAIGMYRISVPVPKGKSQAAAEQEERRSWRLMLLLIKAKLEAVREGATTIEREFLSDRLLYDGQTVGQWAEAELQEATRLGRMPTTLLLTGPGEKRSA